MQSMPYVQLPLRASRLVLGLAVAFAVATVAPATRAETGGPLPQAYPNEVTAPAPQVAPEDAEAPPSQPAQVVAPAAPPEQAPQVSNDPSDEYADADPSALTDFREPLAPYGQWTSDPTYGTIWVPDGGQVGSDFAPYQTEGSWGMTEGGDWAWQSDYAWGHIPFHYGRWVWTGASWGWIPGRRYAPAWVTWRVGEGGYVGWAPLPPSWYWRAGVPLGLAYPPYAAFCFVPTRYAFSGNVASYVVRDRGMVQSIAANTRAYHPATPGVGHAGGGRNARMSPSLAEAHVSASAAPRAFTGHDVRATAFATRSSTAAAQRSFAARSGGRAQASAQPATRAGAWSSGYRRPSRAQAPSLRTPPSYGQASRGYPASHAGYAGASGYHGGQRFAPQVARPVSRPSQPASHAAPRFVGGRSGGGRRR